MTDIINVIFNSPLPFFRNALIAGILSSISFGVIGAFVNVRGLSSMSGAISHSVLAGIGLSLFLEGNYSVHFFPPMAGALVVAIIVALIISTVDINKKNDIFFNAIWAVGMAIGILLIQKTPIYVDPMSYLFGDIQLVTSKELLIIITLDVIVLASIIPLFKYHQAIAFDEEFAKSIGLPVKFFNVFLMILISLSIVVMVSIVGIILVIALLILPAATALLFSKSLKTTAFMATIITMVTTTSGMIISYPIDAPSGSIIIIIVAVIYLILLLIKRSVIK